MCVVYALSRHLSQGYLFIERAKLEYGSRNTDMGLCCLWKREKTLGMHDNGLGGRRSTRWDIWSQYLARLTALN